MSLLSTVLLGLLAVWFLLSVLSQFRQVAWLGDWISRLKGWDHLALLPSWTFFAPNPGTRDYELLYRDRLVDGTYTPWKEVERPVGTLARAVWNPSKRRQKAVVDLCSILMRYMSRIQTERGARRVLLSVPYLSLLTYISGMKTGPLSAQRQFLIAHTFGYHSTQEPDILYISHPHALREEEARPAAPAPVVEPMLRGAAHV
jgi:hypothetical protein